MDKNQSTEDKNQLLRNKILLTSTRKKFLILKAKIKLAFVSFLKIFKNVNFVIWKKWNKIFQIRTNRKKGESWLSNAPTTI